MQGSDSDDGISSDINNRRDFLWKSSMSGLALMTASVSSLQPAQALVKGNAPPPKKSATTALKCTNVDECQKIAEQKEQELKEERELNSTPTLVTKKGTRYKDLELGDPDKGVVEDGNEVTLIYKVLKLGKRSYDGISGEGTVVFSRGYGLEDDETALGTKSFVTTVGSVQNIRALNDAIVGMNVNGMRRFSVQPQAGWEKPTKLCDGGPGGQGAGGDLKTDYVVVPTATMVSTETCFDNTKLPFPISYGEQRRMAQRFDQALIMEVQVLKVDKNGGLM